MILPYRTELEYDIEEEPAVTYALIAVNVLVYLFTSTLSADELDLFFLNHGFSAFEFSPTMLLTTMFLHADFFHLAGNMFCLYLYGAGVEAAFGKIKYLLYYLAFGIFGTLLHWVMLDSSARDIPLVGASGAISGVMGAFFVAHPTASIRHLVIFLPQIRFSLPAWVVLGEWFISQVRSAGGASGAGIAFFAHIGGFAAAFFLTTWLKFGGDFRRAFARSRAHQAVAEAMSVEGLSPRMAADMVRKELLKNPDNPQLRYWSVVTSSRLGDRERAASETKEVLACVPSENPKARLDAFLARNALATPLNLPEDALEFGKLLSGAKRHEDAERILGDFLVRHADLERKQRNILLFKQAELLANQLHRRGEALPLFEEIAKGPAHEPLVQAAEFELKKLAHGAG